MIARIAFGSLALALLCPPVNADKFYFGSAADAKKTQGNAKNYVEGVLLKQDKDTYTIRILGGEMNVAKSMVYKIEKDGLTVAQLEGREKARTEALARAETNRRQVQAAEASARREARAVEATTRRERPRVLEINVDFQGVLGNFFTGGRSIRVFDPVLHRTNLSGLPDLVDTYMRDVIAAQRGNSGSTPAERDLEVQLNFSSNVAPMRFKTYDPDMSQRDLDDLQQYVYSYVERQVRLAAHQNPYLERMNLPWRR